jgi:uroporphyrin-III C-methyltransferase / precorrin-2 dehydrogenase / sirohydrochlorin ferrochelatase
MNMSGKVYLVGAGPGDPELLTRKAWGILQSADAVLHDELVSEQILALLPAAAQVVNVGKRCGQKKVTQSEINKQMIGRAHAGETVVRLKGGDPVLFGRAGEEMEALQEAGVEFEVVPGVTAVLGAAAAARISLTDRRHASRVVFITAHRCGGATLAGERNLAADTTYVIYMPGNRYAAIAAQLRDAGVGEEVPCAIISRATTPREKIVLTTVGKLSQRVPEEAPSLLVVGAVVGLAAGDQTATGEVEAALRAEILSLKHHPLHQSFWRNGVQ